MKVLVSKVQYKRSEKGEFHDIQKRNLNETIDLLLNYPWDTERKLASIELSCPGITIEHQNKTYLKIGPYFSGKFSIYYLDYSKTVRLKIINHLNDAIMWITAYFEQDGKLIGLDKYGFVFNAITHFRTNPFIYVINTKATIKFFQFPITIMVIIFFIGVLKYLEQPESFSLKFIGIMAIFVFVLSAPLIFFFFNYLSADKNFYLKLSRGHNEFIYGTNDNKKVYDKKGISQIIAYGLPNTRSLWRECEIFIITFKDGEQIKFTSLLINGSTFREKFPENQIKEQRKAFPKI